MKYIIHLFLWILTLFLTLSAFAFLPGPAGFLSLLLIAVVIPLEEWQDFLGKYTRRWLRPLAAAALSAILFFSPSLPADISGIENAVPPAINSSAALTPSAPATPTVPVTPSAPVAPVAPVTPSAPAAPAAPIVQGAPQEELPSTEDAAPSQQQTAPPAAQENGTLVWIPTRGGVKYHTHSGCSDMIEPLQVSVSTAIDRGFDACKKCYN